MSLNSAVFVVKYGGHAMDDEALNIKFAANVAQLVKEGARVVIVHGGGPQINAMLKKLDVPSEFKNGLRVTDPITMQVVEMVLCGTVNKSVVNLFEQNGAKAVGISGKDGRSILASKLKGDVDLGLVGEVEKVDPKLLTTLLNAGYVPVIAPVGVGSDGTTYNINADSAAGAVAAALKADCFVLVTDVPGVMNEEGKLLSSLTRQEALGLIESGVVHGGMIPKVKSCLAALNAGVKRALIMDGREENNLYLSLSQTGGVHTFVLPDE